jgi:hypothetical protein
MQSAKKAVKYVKDSTERKYYISGFYSSIVYSISPHTKHWSSFIMELERAVDIIIMCEKGVHSSINRLYYDPEVN